MTITEAQKKIDLYRNAGLLSNDEAARYSRMIRRTERYGNRMHWSEQKRMRANLVATLNA